MLSQFSQFYKNDDPVSTKIGDPFPFHQLFVSTERMKYLGVSFNDELILLNTHEVIENRDNKLRNYTY